MCARHRYSQSKRLHWEYAEPIREHIHSNARVQPGRRAHMARYGVNPGQSINAHPLAQNNPRGSLCPMRWPIILIYSQAHDRRAQKPRQKRHASTLNCTSSYFHHSLISLNTHPQRMSPLNLSVQTFGL